MRRRAGSAHCSKAPGKARGEERPRDHFWCPASQSLCPGPVQHTRMLHRHYQTRPWSEHCEDATVPLRPKWPEARLDLRPAASLPKGWRTAHGCARLRSLPRMHTRKKGMMGGRNYHP